MRLNLCAHHAKNAAQVDALIGVKRELLIGNGDPDPRVAGKGIRDFMRGLTGSSIGVREDEARRGHGGWLAAVSGEPPLVTLELAPVQSDGRMTCHR
jgi:diaminohydroxyphosphoribosylaminopyrimidine deaminase/5-amino-6-(5-phosphoribosylamino)uracil reductase